MREVARYGFTTGPGTAEDAAQAWLSARSLVDRWLTSKGRRNEIDGTSKLELVSGRTANLSTHETTSTFGEMISWTIDEPIDSGAFRTAISVARTGGKTALACELDAGAPLQVLAPVVFEARCPQVLRDILEGIIPWFVGETRVIARPLRFTGDDGGAGLSDLITSDTRSLPLVVVSEREGFVLHPGVAEEMARELAGLAVVASVSDSASWFLTRALGADWSCYNGAIRLYWPFRAMDRSAFRHPLWTSRRLLADVDGTEQAARRIRTQLRRRILGLSTLTIRRDPLFDEIEQSYRVQTAELKRREAASQGELVTLLEADNSRLEVDNRTLLDRVSRLETDLANARAIANWERADEADEALLPDDELAPGSVDEAVEKAKARYPRLVFGDDVIQGIADLAETAGPPNKILGYLGSLSALGDALDNGALGATIVQWLKDRGVHVSGESETIRNSRAEIKERTWHDGQKRREFDLHLKPSDATSPDRCVRIYFDWNAEKKKIVVGWVGPKPGI